MSLPLAFYGDDNNFDWQALQRQDAAEFERLYTRYETPLRLYLVRLCGDSDMAYDLLQETFVKVYRALPRIPPPSGLRPWLYKIATNTARSAARPLRNRLFSKPPPDERMPVTANFESDYAETELVIRALTAIKPDYAAPLLLHWREGFSIDELCLILNLNRENLKKRLYRAKNAFRTAYTKECALADEGRM